MTASVKLDRGLGPWKSTSLVLGGIIGVSIFLVSSAMADRVGTPGLLLLTWALSGLLATIAAMAFAELGASVPENGGTYAFLRRAFPGTPIAFSFAWMMFFAYSTGAIAVVAIMAANYLGQFAERFMPYSERTSTLVAVTIIMTLTTLNYFGARLGGGVQTAITALKVSAVIFAIVCALFIFQGEAQPLGAIVVQGDSLGVTAANVGGAMVLSFFSYSGAYFVTHVAEEIAEPEKNIPRAIIISMATVLLLYMLLNIAYVYVLPFEVLQRSERVGADMMQAILGPVGADVLTLIVVVSAIGALNAQILNYPRIIFALARDGLFFQRVAEVHPKHRSPSVAILLIGIIASLFALAGTYRQILEYVGFVMHLFICLAVVAVIVLRIREPNLDRPFKVWGYPYTLVLFLLLSVAYLGNLLINSFANTIVGVLIVLSGLPFFYYWRRQCRVRQALEPLDSSAP